MYYRYLTYKNKKYSGLFHPKQNWLVPKENGLYDVVRKNFSTLGYVKTFQGKTVSWFTEKGNKKFESGIKELIEFYSKYDVKVICIKQNALENIVEKDDFQVWCQTSSKIT